MMNINRKIHYLILLFTILPKKNRDKKIKNEEIVNNSIHIFEMKNVVDIYRWSTKNDLPFNLVQNFISFHFIFLKKKINKSIFCN